LATPLVAARGKQQGDRDKHPTPETLCQEIQIIDVIDGVVSIAILGVAAVRLNHCAFVAEDESFAPDRGETLRLYGSTTDSRPLGG
jgi:hypothetical protein